MGNSLAGRIIYFWIFVISALFFGKIFGLPQTPKVIILLIVGAGVVYWLVVWMRVYTKKRAERKRG